MVVRGMREEKAEQIRVRQTSGTVYRLFVRVRSRVERGREYQKSARDVCCETVLPAVSQTGVPCSVKAFCSLNLADRVGLMKPLF